MSIYDNEPDLDSLKARLAPAGAILEADGYGLEVGAVGGELDLWVIATAQACVDCLVPKELMTGVFQKLLDPDGGRPVAFHLHYPGDNDR